MTTYDDDFVDPYSYIEWIVKAREIVYSYDINQSEEITNAFNFISMSLKSLFPDIPEDEYLTFGRGVKWHQMWAARDQREFHLVKTTTIDDPFDTLERARDGGSPMIFCTYHVGSYRLINFILDSFNIPFSLVVDNDFASEQQETVLKVAQEFRESPFAVGPGELEIINAEEATGALKALRRLKQGKSLLLYIDGNTGVGGHTASSDKYLAVDFLSHSLNARKGIAYLSHIANVPIVPILCVRTGWLDRRIDLCEPIVPDLEIDRGAYCQRTTQALFAKLEEYVRRYPQQWEGWMYVHKFIIASQDTDNVTIMKTETAAIPEFRSDIPFTFNESRFSLLAFPKGDYLFDKQTFKVIEVPDTMKQVLMACMEPVAFPDLSFETFIVSEKAIRDLFNHNVIIHVPDTP